MYLALPRAIFACYSNSYSLIALKCVRLPIQNVQSYVYCPVLYNLLQASKGKGGGGSIVLLSLILFSINMPTGYSLAP